MNPMYFQEDHGWFTWKPVVSSYVSRISVEVRAKLGYECTKFSQIKNNIKVINQIKKKPAAAVAAAAPASLYKYGVV